MGYIGEQCQYPSSWNEVDLFYWQLAFPFLAVVLCCAWWLVKTAYARLPALKQVRERMANMNLNREAGRVRVIKNKQTLSSMFHTPQRFLDYAWIKLLMFLITGYPVLVYTAFSVFPCQADARGDLYLANMPAVACYGTDHWNMMFTLCAYIPVVLCGVPALLCHRLMWGLKADLLNRCNFMECYGWIYSR